MFYLCSGEELLSRVSSTALHRFLGYPSNLVFLGGWLRFPFAGAAATIPAMARETNSFDKYMFGALNQQGLLGKRAKTTLWLQLSLEDGFTQSRNGLPFVSRE